MIFAHPVRTQKGFRYRNADLTVVWTTSQPQTIEEALAYFERVAGWGLNPQYLEFRDAGQDKWTPVPQQYLHGRVVDI